MTIDSCSGWPAPGGNSPLLQIVGGTEDPGMAVVTVTGAASTGALFAQGDAEPFNPMTQLEWPFPDAEAHTLAFSGKRYLAKLASADPARGTVLLLHMNGADCDVFDAINPAHIVYNEEYYPGAPYVDPSNPQYVRQVGTTSPWLGGKSAEFRAAYANQCSETQYLRSYNWLRYNLGFNTGQVPVPAGFGDSTNFGVDAWVKPTIVNSPFGHTIIQYGDRRATVPGETHQRTTFSHLAVLFIYSGGKYYLRLEYVRRGINVCSDNAELPEQGYTDHVKIYQHEIPDPQNAWAHIEIAKVGSAAYFFLNGALIGVSDVPEILLPDANYDQRGFVVVGTSYTRSYAKQSRPYIGYMAELRMTSYGAHTSNFTPPSAPYLDNADTEGAVSIYRVDQNKMLLDRMPVNSVADTHDFCVWVHDAALLLPNKDATSTHAVVYNPATGAIVNLTVPGVANAVAAAVSAKKSHTAFLLEDGRIAVYVVTTWSLIYRHSLSTDEGTTYVYNTSSSAPTENPTLTVPNTAHGQALVYHPKQAYLLVSAGSIGEESAGVRVLETTGFTQKRRLTFSDNPVVGRHSAMAFDAQGTRLAVLLTDAPYIQLFNTQDSVEDWATLPLPQYPTGATKAVAFSPKGRYLGVTCNASGSDPNVLIYDLSGDSISIIEGVEVASIAWDHAGSITFLPGW